MVYQYPVCVSGRLSELLHQFRLSSQTAYTALHSVLSTTASCCILAAMVLASHTHILMDGSEQNSESDINRVKYYLAFMKYSRECLEDAFYLLYTTWGRGRSYATLQEFCVDCLGIQKEQLSDILCQSEIVPPLGSTRTSTTLTSGVDGYKLKTSNELSRGSNGASHSPLSPSSSVSHVIRSSLLRNPDELNVQQDVTDTAGPLKKLSLGEEKNHREQVTFYISEGITRNLPAEAFSGGDTDLSYDVPRPQNANAGISKVASTNHMWSLVRRLLIPKPALGKKTHDSDVTLERESVVHTAQSLPYPPSTLKPSPSSSLPPSPPSSQTPIRKISVHEVQTHPRMADEDLKSLKEDESQNIINVIQEAKCKLKSAFFLHENGQQSCFLNVEPNPNQMPLSVLIILLTKVFPEITPTIHHLVEKLQRLVYAVCYQDLVFDDHQLKFRLQNISVVISKLIGVVISSCTALTTKFVAEVSTKLRISKQRMRCAQEEYNDYLKCVEKTREELQVVQKELKEAQERNSVVLLAYSRSCSQESDDTRQREAKEVTCIDDDVIGRMDSGNLSLSEEVGGRESQTQNDDGDDECYSDSLLVSVMREVALIEKRHNSLRPFDRRLKMMVRETHKSVILTKREMRERLNSNVSAEEKAMSKEEILSSRQRNTRVLSKEVRKLRRNLENLQSDEKAIMSRINHDLEALREDELVEAALREGQRGVQKLREGSGLLLFHSRQEAKKFASRARIPDLGKWVMKRVFGTTPVRQVYSSVRAADTRDNVNITDFVGLDGQQPSVIILSGPKGSGKTCMAHYLLQQWESNEEAIKSSIHEFDLVVYGTVGNILSSGSWVQYLREHIFCLTLVDLPEAEIYGALNTISVLYLLDVDTTTPSITKILDDVFGNLGNNQVVVTTRPDSEGAIAGAVKHHNIKCQQVRICPMTFNAIQQYSTSVLSLVEQDDSVISRMAKQFSRFLSSMKTIEDVMYPLPVTYLLYLWHVNSSHAFQATSMSRLVSQMIVVAENSLVEALKMSGKYDGRAGRIRAEQCTKQLCEAAWELISGHGWPYDGQFLLESKNMSFTNPLEISSFSTLIIVKESTDGRPRASFLHPCITEILCGFFLTQQRLLHKGPSMLRRREKLEKYCVPEIKRYKEVLPHAAGALVYNAHKFEDAKEIATLFFSSLSDKRDMIAWHNLLSECGFLPTMCAAVSSLLSCYSCWNVAHHSQETNCALAELLKREAYHPQTVVISQEGKFCCNSECVIRALATCSSTFVHLRQESQFYAWGEATTSDSLILPLQPAGTLQEFWGHLGVEGALALRHFHQLMELNVRVSSCEALETLTYSIKRIGRSLRYLYIRLDLPTSTPMSDIEPLKFKGKNLWLRMKGVEDGNLSWVKKITAKLSDWYTEVLLEKSRLSPPALQELKQSLPNTPIHIFL